MQCSRCGTEMFTASMMQPEVLTEDLIFKHLVIHHECGNCGVILNIFIPALAATKVLKLKRGT